MMQNEPLAPKIPPSQPSGFISNRNTCGVSNATSCSGTPINAKHLIPGPDAQEQAVFDQGHELVNSQSSCSQVESKWPMGSTISTKSLPHRNRR